MNVDVETSTGRVRGIARGASAAFLGIPYAEPPLGAARFAAPAPRRPWPGVLDATRVPAIAPQGALFAPGVGAEGLASEDCLTLNVFTPRCDGEARPVMFWIHGGAFTVGTAYGPLYDGQRLAERHDVVVVSANYRLGALGFSALGAAGEAPGFAANAGLLDLAEALRWLRDSARAFGGDPGCVTLFGESAGASLVCSLLAHPPARGLFHRAIAQSAVDPTRVAARERGAARADTLLAALGAPAGDYAALRSAPLHALMAAQKVVEADGARWPHFFPVLEASLPLAPADALLRADTPSVPLLVGYNRDEWNLFEAGRVADWEHPLADDAAVAQVAAALAHDKRPRARALFDTYRSSRSARSLRSDPRSLIRAIIGDARFRFGSAELLARSARRTPHSYGYLFSYASPGLRGALGACHALDLPFVFGTLDAPNQERFAGTGEAVARLSGAMMHAWTQFARTGAPALPDGTPWPSYGETRRTVVLDREIGVEDDPFGEERRSYEA